MKLGATLGDVKDPARRLKRLREQRDTLREHVAQLEDKIAIIEHEIRDELNRALQEAGL